MNGNGKRYKELDSIKRKLSATDSRIKEHYRIAHYSTWQSSKESSLLNLTKATSLMPLLFSIQKCTVLVNAQNWSVIISK